MSQYDHGKHNTGKTPEQFGKKEDISGSILQDGTVRSDKRLDAQKVTKTTARRMADYDNNKGLNAAAYHRPGTQNKAK